MVEISILERLRGGQSNDVGGICRGTYISGKCGIVDCCCCNRGRINRPGRKRGRVNRAIFYSGRINRAGRK